MRTRDRQRKKGKWTLAIHKHRGHAKPTRGTVNSTHHHWL